uniref:SFRICE_014002 n=1 Tax=Spodoptera frugiperda TaxID=7108 RepID=A0A2H1W6F7_SPOFR
MNAILSARKPLTLTGTMWLRFLTFCVLVSLVLIAVLSTIYGRPVINIFFRRCCTDDIENDQTIFANLNDNFLRERLVSDGIFSDGDYVEVREVNATEVGDIDLIGDGDFDTVGDNQTIVNRTTGDG